MNYIMMTVGAAKKMLDDDAIVMVASQDLDKRDLVIVRISSKKLKRLQKYLMILPISYEFFRRSRVIQSTMIHMERCASCCLIN